MANLTPTDLDRLNSELASFARSGVPMPEGLKQLRDSLQKGALHTLAADLAAATEKGVPLSEALESSQVSLPPEFPALVRCGEISGNMGEVLDFAQENGRRLRRHKAAVSTMFVYPMLVLLVLFLVLGFTMVFLVPKFKDIYDQLGAELPEITQAIIGLSYGLSHLGFFLFILIAALFIYVIVAAFRERLPEWMLNSTPGVNRLVSLSDTAIMSEFIGHLISSGVPLPQACRAASLVVSRRDMRASLEAMAAHAEAGGDSGHALNPRMPATAAWLYRQGEERGTLADACRSIARYCESRFELLSRRSLYLMEPMFILLVSVLVGVFIISLYLPLFNIPKLVGK